MINKIVSVLLAVSLFSLPAFAGEIASPEQIFKQKVAAAKTNIQSINPGTLRSWIAEDKDFILVDVREGDEVNAIKINAEEFMAIPRGVIEVKAPRMIKELDTTLVLYCLKGSRGALATAALKELGYSNVFNLESGILGWIKEGYAVENMFGTFEMKDYVSNYK